MTRSTAKADRESGCADLERLAVTIGRMAASDPARAEVLAAELLDAAIADAEGGLAERPHVRSLATRRIIANRNG